MKYPKTPLAHAKEIIEANPGRVFFLIAEDSAFLEGFGADILSPTDAPATQTVVAIDLNDPAWTPALVGQRLADVIDHGGRPLALVGTTEHAKTYSIRSAITIWV